MTLKATNDNVWVIRHETDTNKQGVIIPPSAQKKKAKGDIVTVGKLVSDDTIKKGRVAIFNKSSGWELEEDGTTYTILTQNDIVGTDENSE